jgi:glycosyltransferase involved in cell wall biosynthesis
MFFELIPRALYPLTKFMFLPLILQTKFSFRRANSIVGHTEEFVDWGLQYAGRRRTPFDKSFPMAYPEYSPNSTSLENFYNFWKKYDLAPGSDRIIISFVGTFGRAFDIETILKSASELKNIYPKLVFVLCGLGDRQSYYKNKAINMSNVIMPGFVNKNDLIALLKITSLGLAPYKNSVGFLYNIPNKPYEYMSESVPIATCLNGSLSKLILKYNCGQTYKEGDSSSLNRLIGKLVSEPKYFAELGKNGRIAYEIFFKSSTVYKAFANHIESIVTRFNT